jgi:hypothetical protein
MDYQPTSLREFTPDDAIALVPQEED